MSIAPVSPPAADTAPGEVLAKPYRLGIVGLGAAIGLFGRLAAANGFGDLTSRTLVVAAAVTSFVIGLGLVLTAAERDRFGPPLIWITAITSLAWGALNWVSPPFDDSVTVWSNRDQAVLALLGAGNGLLLAGIIALALVRRAPSLTVAATLLAGLAALLANTVLLREEWPAIIALGAGFALILLAWDRSPRRERRFERPEEPPRVSRAALSFISVALCGTAIQLWTSRTDIPRSLPAIALCAVLVFGAFASMIRVRREIEQRETTLSEWRSWMRESRTNDFRSEIETFDSAATTPATFDPRPPVGLDGEAPRKLSFPNLVVPDEPAQTTDEPATPAAAAAAATAPIVRSPQTDLPPVAVVPEPVTDVSLTPELSLTADAAPQFEKPQFEQPVADVAPLAASGTMPQPDLPLAPIDGPPADALPVPPISLPRVDLAPTASGFEPAEPAEETEPAATRAGAFSSMLTGIDQAPASQANVEVADLQALNDWLQSPAAAARSHPLLVAVEAMSLDEFESLPPEDAMMARDEIGSYLADTMPAADLVAWIDGPYFIIAHASKPVAELSKLNKAVQATLRSTDGIHAFLRPGTQATLDEIVDEAVIGILQARQQQAGPTR